MGRVQHIQEEILVFFVVEPECHCGVGVISVGDVVRGIVRGRLLLLRDGVAYRWLRLRLLLWRGEFLRRVVGNTCRAPY